MRINKYLAAAGIASRREADRLVGEGRVLIDGRPAKPGDDVGPEQSVTVDGRPVSGEEINKERIILLYNKPEGLVCSASDKDGETVLDHIDYPKRLFYAGRLDKASRGLMLLTNDGQLANDLMRARNAHEREYVVSCTSKVEDETLKALSKGVYIPELDVKTRRCKVSRISDREFSITLTQGLNRQIRRMCEQCGVRVADLCRVRIANLTLGKLREGTYRKIKPEEKESLLALIYKKEN